YRVAVIAPDGGTYDLSWNGVKQFCKERGLNHVPELWSGFFINFIPGDWQDSVYSDFHPDAVPLSKKGTVDEGVCVRRDGVIPFVAKSKSPKFLEHESKILDQEQEVLS